MSRTVVAVVDLVGVPFAFVFTSLQWEMYFRIPQYKHLYNTDTALWRTFLRSLPSPKLLTVLTSIMQIPLYCGQLCLCSVPLTLVKPLPAKNSIVRAPRYIRESSIGSRESLPLQYGHLCINWFQRCQFTQSLTFNKDNAVTRTPASVLVVSVVTNYDHIVSPPNRIAPQTSLMLPDCLAFE